MYAKPISGSTNTCTINSQIRFICSPTTNRNAKLYSHESTWRGWKTRGLAHRFPLRKLSLRRSSSLNHLTESSPRSTTRPLRLPSCVVSFFPPSIPLTEQSVKFSIETGERIALDLFRASRWLGVHVDSSVVSTGDLDNKRWANVVDLSFPFAFLVGEFMHRKKNFLFFFLIFV